MGKRDLKIECFLRASSTYLDFSVSKTTRELLLKWSNEPVRLSSEVKMPQFLVENVIAESCDESSVMGKLSLETMKLVVV